MPLELFLLGTTYIVPAFNRTARCRALHQACKGSGRFASAAQRTRCIAVRVAYCNLAWQYTPLPNSVSPPNSVDFFAGGRLRLRCTNSVPPPNSVDFLAGRGLRLRFPNSNTIRGGGLGPLIPIGAAQEAKVGPSGAAQETKVGP